MYKEYAKISHANFEFHNLIDVKNHAYLKDREFQLREWFQKISWIHVNPSVDKAIKESEKFISKTVGFSNTIENLLNFIYKSDKSLLLFRGVRGSGKTFIQNYFLNTETRNMNKKNITWIRVDVAKIYTYNNENPDPITFLDYLWAQIVFVYVRYCQLDTDIVGRSYDSYDKVFESIKNEDVFAIFNSDKEKYNYIQTIRNAKQDSNSLIGKPFKLKETEHVANNIIKLLQKKGKKLILFVDGVDNVDFSKAIREDIQNSVLDFYNKNMENNFFNKMVFAVRTELDIGYKLLLKSKESACYGDEFIDKNIDIESITLNEYLNFIQGLVEKDTNLNQNIFDEYIRFCKKLPNVIENELERLDINFKKFDILNDLFDNDFRDMNTSFLATYIYIKDYFTLASSGDNGRQRRSFNSIFEIMDKQGFICLESLFKNGLRYGASAFERRYTPPYRNLGFLNLFNPAEHNRISLNPLLASYILKYLSVQNDFTEYISVLHELAASINGFNMIEKANFDILEVLLESNYICYTHDLVGNDEIKQKVKLTTKGDIALKVVYRHINVFHSNIYGGFQLATENLGIKIYSIDGKGYFNAILSNIPTYITFLEYEQVEIINRLKGTKFENIKLELDLYNTYISNEYYNFYLNYSKYNPDIEMRSELKLTINKLLNNFPECEKTINQYSFKKFIKLIEDIQIPGTIRALLMWKLYKNRFIDTGHEYLEPLEAISLFIENIEDIPSIWDYIGIDNKGELQTIIKNYEEHISLKNRNQLNKTIINICKHIKDTSR